MRNEEHAIRTVTSAYATAWNLHTAENFPQIFFPTADFVTFQGTWIKGAPEIQKAHTFIFSGPFKNTAISYQEELITFLGTDVAISRAKWELSGHDATGNPFASRTGMFIFVLHRTTQGWLIVAGQNTDIETEQIYKNQ